MPKMTPRPRSGTDSSMVSDVDSSNLVEQRVGSVLTVAREFGRPIPLDEFLDLLPENGPASRDQVLAWLRGHPRFRPVVAELLGGMEDECPDPLRDERRLRAINYLRAGTLLLDTTLGPLRNLLCCVAVTGSTAYGEPGPEDDCDLLVITRDGATWAFLTFAFLGVRLRRLFRGNRADPVWCFNYVVNDSSARHDYSGPRGFLFAREALMAKPLEGEGYYRGLLGASNWLRAEAPRLYARWERAGSLAKLPVDARAGFVVRLFDALAFPWVAAYLQAIGLFRNARHRNAGDKESAFRTVTLPGRMTFLVAKFERLRGIYAPATAVRPESESRSHARGAGESGPIVPVPARPSRPSEAQEGSGPLSG